jgi:hypothetical protein
MRMKCRGVSRSCRKDLNARAEGNSGDGEAAPSLVSKPSLSRAPARLKPREADQFSRFDRPRVDRGNRNEEGGGGFRGQQSQDRDRRNGQSKAFSKPLLPA